MIQLTEESEMSQQMAVKKSLRNVINERKSNLGVLNGENPIIGDRYAFKLNQL